jgi:hypothetical protein
VPEEHRNSDTHSTPIPGPDRRIVATSNIGRAVDIAQSHPAPGQRDQRGKTEEEGGILQSDGCRTVGRLRSPVLGNLSTLLCEILIGMPTRTFPTCRLALQTHFFIRERASVCPHTLYISTSPAPPTSAFSLQLLAAQTLPQCAERCHRTPGDISVLCPPWAGARLCPRCSSP